MRIRPSLLIGGIFAAAAATTALVVHELPREGQVSPAPAGAPSPVAAISPIVEPTATEADGFVDVRVTAGGEPVAGAEVRLFLAAPGAGAEDVRWLRAGEARANGAGTARIAARPGDYLAAARAPGLATGRAEVVRAPGEDVTRAEVALAPAVSLSGRAVVPSGGPAAGARVSLVPAVARGLVAAPPEEVTTVTAAADGTFAVDGLAPGVYAVRAEGEGLHTVLVPRVAVPRDGPLALRLEPLGAISGRVRLADGAPVAGAKVRAASRDHAAVAVAGADGAFTVRVPAGGYRLLATAGERAGSAAAPVPVAAGGAATADIALGPASALDGTAVSAASGAPLPGAEILLFSHETAAPIARATADARGAFVLPGLAPGAYDLRAAAPGAFPARVSGLSLEAGRRFALRVALPGLGAIEGVVRDASGGPLAGVRVRLARRGDGLEDALAVEARSGFDGRYRLEAVETGRAELVAAQDGAALGEARAVQVRPGGTSRADFFLPAPGVLEGRVSLGGRAPPAGTTVVVVPLRAGAGTAQVARAVADATGNYRVVVPAGEYRVHAAPSELARADLRVAPAFARVDGGRTARLDVAATPGVVDHGPEILVLEPGGAPSSGAVVTLARAGDERVALATTAGEDGRVVLASDMGLAGRPVTVRARNGGRAGVVTAELPARGSVAVPLSPGGALDGAVRATGRRVSGFTLEVSSRPAPEGWRTLEVHRFAGDRFELADLPAEPLRLVVRTDDGRRGTADVRVPPGEAGRVTVDVR